MSVFGSRAIIGMTGALCALVMLLACGKASAQTLPDTPAVTGSVPAARAPSRETQPLGPPGKNLVTGGGRAPAATHTDSSSRPWVGQTLLPLMGVLALAAGVAAVLRTVARRQGGLRATLGAGGRAPSGILEVLGRYPVGRGVTLVLLKLDSRILLLSQSAGGRLGAGAHFSTLAEITDPEQVASILVRSRDAEGDSLAEKFKSLLTRFDRQMEPEKPALPAAPATALWDGSRSDIPIIDLTKRDSGRAPSGTLRTRVTNLRGDSGVRR